MVSKVNIQTLPIDAKDQNFKEIAEFTDELMRKRGYPMKAYKGSLSWFPAQAAGRETIAKLCFLERGDYWFGLREEECTKHGLLELRYPRTFGVRPKTAATFHGFPVSNDQTSREALEKFIGRIPEVPPDLRAVDRAPDQEFDINDFLRQF